MVFQSSSEWKLSLESASQCPGRGAGGCAWDEDRRQEGPDAACSAAKEKHSHVKVC